jgi:hypothetical protein
MSLRRTVLCVLSHTSCMLADRAAYLNEQLPAYAVPGRCNHRYSNCGCSYCWQPCRLLHANQGLVEDGHQAATGKHQSGRACGFGRWL